MGWGERRGEPIDGGGEKKKRVALVALEAEHYGVARAAVNLASAVKRFKGARTSTNEEEMYGAVTDFELAAARTV